MDHPETKAKEVVAVPGRKATSMRREDLLKKCTMSVLLANLDKDLLEKASEVEEASLQEEVSIDLAEAISIPTEEAASSDQAEVDHLEREEMTRTVLKDKDSIELPWAALSEEIAESSEAPVEAEEAVAAIEVDTMVLKEAAAELENLGFLQIRGMETSVERAKRQLLLECTKDPEEVEARVPSKTEPDFPHIYVIEKNDELFDQSIF